LLKDPLRFARHVEDCRKLKSWRGCTRSAYGIRSEFRADIGEWVNERDRLPGTP
jgi:hypothetical protein